MLARGRAGQITNWSVELDDGDLALLRYTLERRRQARRRPTPRRSTRSSTRWCAAGCRASRRRWASWSATGARDPARAHLSRPASPKAIAIRTGAEEAARDIVCLAGPRGCRATRDVRLFRRDDDAADRLRLKIYRRRRDHPAVRSGAGVREFRLPRARRSADAGSAAARTGYVHDFDLQLPGGGDAAAVLTRAEVVERGDRRGARRQGRERRVQPADRRRRAGAARGRAVPRLVPLSAPDRPGLLAWSPSSTRCAARPRSPRALIALFAALHDPALAGPRDEAVEAAEKAIDTGLASVAAIDEDRILRADPRRDRARPCAPTPSRPPATEALAFKLDSALGARPARAACRGARSGSIRRASRASTCAPARSRAAACAGPTGATISAPRSSG